MNIGRGRGLGGLSGGGMGSNNKSASFFIVVAIIVLTVFFNLGGREVVEKEKPEKKETEQVFPKKEVVVKPKEEEKEKEVPEVKETFDKIETETSEEGIFDITEGEKEHFVVTNARLESEYLPLYDGENKNIAVNGGFADFDIDQFFKGGKSITSGWVDFSNLDGKKRASKARAFLTPEYVGGKSNTDKLNKIQPTGFKNKKVDGTNVFNKSYLINPRFVKEDVSKIENVITGTNEFSSSTNWGLEYYNLMIEDAINQGHSVILEVNPLYIGKNVISSGVQIRAISYGSEYLDFNVFVYNVQDNLKINYLDGTTVSR